MTAARARSGKVGLERLNDGLSAAQARSFLLPANVRNAICDKKER